MVARAAPSCRLDLGACRTLVVEARIWLLEDRFSTNCRRIAPLWVKIRRIVDQADGFAARPTKVRQAPSVVYVCAASQSAARRHLDHLATNGWKKCRLRVPVAVFAGTLTRVHIICIVAAWRWNSIQPRQQPISRSTASASLTPSSRYAIRWPSLSTRIISARRASPGEVKIYHA